MDKYSFISENGTIREIADIQARDTNTMQDTRLNALEAKRDVYSAEETATNKVWVDGKTIFRKVITGITYGSGAISVQTGVTDIETVVRLDFFEEGVTTSAYKDWAYFGNSRAGGSSRINKKTGVFNTDGRSGTAIAGNNGVLILEYTKV